MIIKCDKIPGDRFLRLVEFILGAENLVDEKNQVVSFKGDIKTDEGWFAVTLEVRDWWTTEKWRKYRGVSEKLLVRVYQILNPS